MSTDRRTTPRWTGPDPDPTDRRRSRWQEFRAAYPGVLTVMWIVLLVLIASDIWLVAQRASYRAETTRLRAGMSDFERQKTDLALASDEKRVQVMMALLRRQADLDEKLHLAVSVDSGRMYLERDRAILRDFPALLGPERSVGTGADTVRMAAPRGKRTVERVVKAGETWALPAWVWEDRGLPVPAERAIPGALGPVAIVLNGGTVVYSQASTGPLADSAYVLPGSVRVGRSHLEAIAPNLHPGMAVYFY